jgi:tetratricopeptide (TPR) repeat protein
MSRVCTAYFISFVAAMAMCAFARADDPARLTRLKTVLVPRKSSSPQVRVSECLQKNPAFFLWDADKKITPSSAGFVYVVEQNKGNRLLLSDLNEGVRGWASPLAMVPLNQAEVYFSGQIKANPRNAFAYLLRGVARFENDDLDHAAGDLDEAVKLDPKYVPALIARAQLWQWRNRLDRAMADASQAIEFDSRNSYAYVERGIFEYNLKKHDKALQDLDKASELGSRAAVIHIARGMIHIEKGELAKAQAEFHHAIELDPKHPDAYSGYASLFLIRGNSKTAISILDQAIDANPQSPESHGNRAVVFLSIGKYDKALDDLDEVIRFAPDSARALRERAWILATCPDAKIRKPEEAITSATRACELTEWNEPPALMTLAAACSETGDFTAAVKWQQKAVELLGEKDPEKQNYHKLLDRYKASKPYHRRGILEENGIQIPGIAAMKSEKSSR